MADEKRLATEVEAREVAEQAREQDWEKRSFARALFEGQIDIGLVHPHPKPDPEEQARAADFLAKLEEFAREMVEQLPSRPGWTKTSQFGDSDGARKHLQKALEIDDQAVAPRRQLFQLNL